MTTTAAMGNSGPDITSLLYGVSANGDEASYRQLFDIFFPSLYRFTRYFLKSPELAEEAASDTMIALWEHRDKLMAIGNVKVWLFVIARSKCLNILKRQQVNPTLSLDSIHVEISFPGKDPEEIYINTEMRKKMEKAVNSLPQRCKLIFKLVKEEGLSYKEAADILHISPKTVDAQLVTAFRKITQAIRLLWTRESYNY
ncbi:MAG: RNA polymerase sigma-70 factor [Sphingobacteriales bacterium]|nr:RNA polymerase sigma-70 factor [Sphingobacteriales bacterium]